jgi:hypothetical protein
MPITPYHHDNRGTRDQPFGFVYFQCKRHDVSARIGYGANRDNPHPLAIWDTANTGPMDNGDRDAIRGYLAHAFPHLVNQPLTSTGA